MISVIISIYKRLDNLELIFLGLERQTFQDFEVIIAEDDNHPKTIIFLEEARKKHAFPIQHVSQEDKGFRKCKILNQAVQAAKGEKLVFLDGDCIPHYAWLKEYNKAIEENVFCCGRRVNLNASFSQKLLKNNSLSILHTTSAIINSLNGTWKRAIYNFPSLRQKDIGIMGCNWGILKKNICEVNGFDEDYEGYTGGEDSDIDWRLLKIGCAAFSIKEKAIVYHLYHQPSNPNPIGWEDVFLNRKKQAGISFCKNGIQKI